MRRTSRLKNFIWYSLVTLLVTVAVLVSVVRLTIGSVSEYRQHLEDMAGRYLGKPVAIAEMDARLVGINPTVVLDDISLLDEQSFEPLAHFSSIRISLNPVSSLRQLRPVVDLSIYGANIVVGFRDDGTLQVQGVTLSKESGNSSTSGALGAWLLSQSRLVLKETTLVWRNWDTGDEAVFVGGNLELQNLQNRHRLSGYVQLPKELGKELRLALDIHGDLLTQKDWEGELYVKAVDVQAANWLQQFDYKGLRLQQGDVDLELWSYWQGGLLEGMEGKFSLADLKFSSVDKPLQLQRLAGKVRYESGDDGWLLQLKDIQLAHMGLPDEQFSLQLEKNALATVIQASSLPLALLPHYAHYLPSLDEKQYEAIAQAAPSGRLQGMHIELGDGGHIRATAEVEEFQFSPWQSYPGLSGLSGHFAMDGSAAQFVMDSHDLVLTWPQLFRQPLKLKSASGGIVLDREDKQWRITGNALKLANQDVRVQIAFDSLVEPGTSPLVSLEAQLEDARAAAVPDYLPVRIMSDETVHWLDKAFVDGSVSSGRVLLHGRLDAFPFRRNHGQFEVELNAKDVTLHYQDGWPVLTQINGEVRFDGPAMVITSPQARIYSSRLRKVRVGITDFRQPVLRVEGKADASLADTLRFIQASPLLQHAGAGLEQMRTRGDTHLDLAFVIPLSRKVAANNPLTVIGQAAFDKGELQLAEGVVLSELSGDLLFTEASFEAKDLQARLYDAPVKLQVFTEKAGEHPQVVVAAQGRVTAKALQRELELPLLARLDGETDWQGRVTIPYGGAADATLALHSTLEGMAIDLPLPAAKTREEAKPLSLTWQLSGESTRAHRLVYDEFVSVVWKHKVKPFQLLGAAVSFGARSEPELLRLGAVHIKGTLDNVQLQAWLQLREQVKAAEAAGSLLPVEVEMERLHLTPSTVELSGGQPRVEALSPINFVVNNFAYGDMALGRVELKLRPDDRVLLVDTLTITAPSFTANGSGQWDEEGNTQLDFAVTSSDFGRMMHELGFATVITDGKISATGRLFWPGSPTSFNLSELGGAVHVKIDEGSIEEVKAGAGKLLGLLSLQALPRRLFLDFSDLSEKGLEFSTLEGDIRFAEGNAFTQNLHLESLPASMLITGRTGLVSRDFDQLIVVVPKVSDTVSVAGALAWGPQAAAILIVLQKLFQSNIDAAAMTRYQLTGTWADPTLTKLNGDPSSAVEEDL